MAFIREVGPVQWAYRTTIRQYYKRVVKREHRMRLPTGEWMTLPVTSKFATEAYITQANVDWGSEKLLNSIIEGKGAFLDVGANIGYYSLYFAPRASAIYSFEPDPRARRSLEQNAKGTKIEVIPCAVGACEGKACFVLEQNAEVSHISASDERGGNQVEVEVITIDAFVAARNLHVQAIKVDAEGHDIEVLNGAFTTLSEQGPVVLIEAESNLELFSIMHKVGYRVFAYVRHSETRKRTFVELLSGVSAPGESKMLFLIPEHMAELIVMKAQAC
jgi:FkbM family methyltransferase